MARVSVVIPTYNCSKFITEAIDSVLNQTYKDLEIIVVDDGSTDKTKEVLKAFIDRKSIYYVYQENKGPGAARNTGIKAAQGEYIAFLDADDQWFRDKLRLQLEYLGKNSQNAFIYTDLMEMHNDQIIYRSRLKEGGYKHVAEGWIYDNLLKESFVFAQTVIVKREILNEVGMFDEGLRIAEDRDLWLRVGEKYQIGFMDEVLTIRRKHDSNLTNKTELYISSQIKMFEKHLKRRMGDLEHKKLKSTRIIRKKLQNGWFDLGYYYLENLETSKARTAFVKSMKYGIKGKAVIYTFLILLPVNVIKYVRDLKKYFVVS